MANKLFDIKRKKFDKCCTPTGNISFVQLLDTAFVGDVALIGSAGCGKSTLINNLLGFPYVHDKRTLDRIKEEIRTCRHDNPVTCKHTYAPAGANEITIAPTPYAFGGNIRLWDIAGFGLKDSCWKQIDIDQFDAYLYVYKNNRVSEDDGRMLQSVLNKGKPVIWVRTFFDATMAVIQNENYEKQLAREILTQVYGVRDPVVYCVSGLYTPNQGRFEYDLNALRTAILQLGQHLQNTIPLQISSELIELKFKKRLKYFSIISCFTTTAGFISPAAGLFFAGTVPLVLSSLFFRQAHTLYGFRNAENEIKGVSGQTVVAEQHRISLQMKAVATLQAFGYATPYFFFLVSKTNIPVATVNGYVTVFMVVVPMTLYLGCTCVNLSWRNGAYRVAKEIIGERISKQSLSH